MLEHNKEYIIFIDESGSLNNKNKNSFLVSLFIVDQAQLQRTKNFCKRQIISMKKQLGLAPNAELKGHTFKINNKNHLVNSFCNKLKSNGCSVAAYISNHNINQKWLNDKNATYNFMIKCALERAIDSGVFLRGSNLKIVADIRSIKSKYLWSIDSYLKSEFVLSKDYFKKIEFKFEDSKKHWGVQVADFFSYYNFCLLNQKFNDKHQWKNIRRIH